MLVGTGEKSFMSCDDQMGITPLQFLCAKSLFVEQAVAKIFQEHVGAREQPMHALLIGRLVEIEHHAAFAAVEQREERGAHASEAAGLVAARRLDLDHLGAKLRE